MSIKLINLDRDQEGELLDSEARVWNIKEIKPIYFHPNRWKNEPVVIRKEFSGRGWKAELTFGYAPRKYEYEELEIEKPKTYMPYNVSINKQGLDIIRNDRIIKMHQLSEIDLIKTKHNKYNYIRGEIDLIRGFTTAITKNNIIRDKNFNELLEDINNFFKKHNYLDEKNYSDKLPEKLLRDRLANYFEKSTLLKKNNIKMEYAIEGLGGYIDILADGEVWELKTGPSKGLDVYQLFAYMDMGNFKDGYLVAEEFRTGAKTAAEFINANHDKKIELIPMDEFPIGDPPSREEIEKYY